MNPRSINSLREILSDWQNYREIPDGSLDTPAVKGVDFTPYQDWAKAKLGFTFNNPSLIVTAFTHRSYVNEHHRVAPAHNERLEFLGDAVLEIAVTDYLYRHYDMPEGILTAWRSALVNTEAIRNAGLSLGYETLIRRSKGEMSNGAKAFRHIIANCFEALIGAIYLDQGFTAANKFIHEHIIINIDEILEEGSWRDAKSYLQEIAQKVENCIPRYRTLETEGPDHLKTFKIAVFVRKEPIGYGIATSKSKAQRDAALMAIRHYQELGAKLGVIAAPRKRKPSEAVEQTDWNALMDNYKAEHGGFNLPKERYEIEAEEKATNDAKNSDETDDQSEDTTVPVGTTVFFGGSSKNIIKVRKPKAESQINHTKEAAVKKLRRSAGRSKGGHRA